MSTRPSQPAKVQPAADLLNQRYRVGRRLGKGGMGAVYEGRDTRLADHVVAIKENTNTSAAAQEQFKREALMLARLQHPNLPKVTDYFIEPSGQQYLVMDYVPGEDLDHILRREGALSEEEALRCMAQVLSAVHYLHTRRAETSGKRQPVIHRDIKPANIKRTPDGHYVLVDFGISKVGANTGTVGSMRALTPGYAPIEQYDGGTDERSDIYSLGATLYALLTLHIPPSATERARKRVAVTSPRKYLPHLSPRSEQAIERAMRVEPGERFQSAAEMHQALLGRAVAGTEEIARTQKRGKSSAVALAAAGLLLAGLAFFFLARAPAASGPDAPAAAGLAEGGEGAAGLAVSATTPVKTPRAGASLGGAQSSAGAADGDLAGPATATPTADATPFVAMESSEGSSVPVATVEDVAAVSATATADSLLGSAVATIKARLSATPTRAAGAAAVQEASATPSPGGAQPARPTSTPLATFTPSPTVTPTPPPPPTATRAATATPARTPTPDAGTNSGGGAAGGVAAPAPNSTANEGPTSVTILAPPDQTSTNVKTTFAWQPNAPLAEGQVYEVVFWRPGEEPNVGNAWTGAARATQVDIMPPDFASGNYRWGVWLGSVASDSYQRLRYLGGGRQFSIPAPSDASENNRPGSKVPDTK